MHSRKTLTHVPVPQRTGLPVWVDGLMIAVILAISGLSLVSTAASGAVNLSLTNDTQWSWHLVRSAGMVSYSLLAASMLWGLFLSSKVLKDWSPGPLTMLLHAATSWLAVVFAAAHALLLMFDNYYSYTLSNILVPFTG